MCCAQSPRGVPAFFSRPPRAQPAQQQQQQQQRQPQSPRKRPAQGSAHEPAGRGAAGCPGGAGGQPQSPRRLRPLLFAAASAAAALSGGGASSPLPAAQGGRDIPAIAPLRLLCPGSLPQPQVTSQHCQ